MSQEHNHFVSSLFEAFIINREGDFDHKVEPATRCLGQVIRAARKNCGYNQETFGLITGKNPKFWSRIEQGQSAVIPSGNSIDMLSDILKLSEEDRIDFHWIAYAARRETEKEKARLQALLKTPAGKIASLIKGAEPQQVFQHPVPSQLYETVRDLL